jgi:hypothetical protein
MHNTSFKVNACVSTVPQVTSAIQMFSSNKVNAILAYKRYMNIFMRKIDIKSILYVNGVYEHSLFTEGEACKIHVHLYSTLNMFVRMAYAQLG